MKNKILGHFLALLTMTIWSSTFVISKIVLESIQAGQVLFIRFIIASIVLTIIYPKFAKPDSMKKEVLLVISGLCLVGYFASENTALTYTNATNVSLIVATIPIISLIIASVFGKEKLWNRNVIIGFVIAYIGVAIIVLNSSSEGSIKLTGDIIALVAAVFFSVYSFVLSKTSGGYNIIRLTRNMFYYMTVALLIFNIASGTLTKEYYSLDILLRSDILLSLLFLGIVASSISFIMWNKAITLIGGMRTSQYIYFGPFITSVMAAFWLKERITLTTIVGAVLIVFGVYLSEQKVKAKNKKEDLTLQKDVI